VARERDSDYFLFVKGNQPGLQRAIYDKVIVDCPGQPDHVELDYGHGRIIKRSLWVTDAKDIDFPHAGQVVRIRRDGYDITGAQRVLVGPQLTEPPAEPPRPRH